MEMKIITHGSHDYRQMVQLREQHLRKPLGLSFSKQELENEKDNLLIGAFENNALLGCCMLTEDGSEKIRLRQMAVLIELQGKGFGRSLVSFAEDVARSKGYKTISMHARKNAAGFYKKLGYKIIGEEFIELSIPHYIMEKNI